MLCFGRSFLPSTFLLFFLLSTAVSVDDFLCKRIQYNPDVFDATPIQQPIEDRVCEKTCPFDTSICRACSDYVCKINTTLYFGTGCTNDVINFCEPGSNSKRSYLSEKGRFIFIGYDDNPKSFELYQKYMEGIKPLGNDSLQERLFWVYALGRLGLLVTDDHIYFWKEKATGYIPMNLQNFINEIQNSEIIVKEKVEEKAKISQIQTNSLSRDLQDVQNAVNQSLPENEYFHQKYAEMEAKMEVIKQNDYIFKSFLAKSSETLFNVETAMNNSQSAVLASFDRRYRFDGYQSIQNKILQTVSSNKEKVLDLLKFANETIENITFVADDEISFIQSVGYEARKAMKDFENEKEMKDLIKEIKDAVEVVKTIGEAAQKTADQAQSIANESNMTAINAEKTAQNANAIAVESKRTSENAGKIAKNAKEVADSAGKNSETSKELFAEALRSNGRKSSRFEAALIFSFLALFLLI